MAVEEEERKNEEEKDLELDLMAEAELLRLTRPVLPYLVNIFQTW
jgi:hypothetical protein